jgi:adenylate cyclase
VFQGKLEGLIVAEIELGSEDEAFELPSWAEKEVSDDPRYYNVNLIKMENAESKMDKP